MLSFTAIFSKTGQVFITLFLKLLTSINKVYQVIVKNYKILLRSKYSALIVVFGPLIIVSLIGFAFNTSTIYDVHIGVFSGSYSDLSDQMVDSLIKENYAVDKYETLESCLEGVKRGETNLCLVFSPGMSIHNQAKNKMTFYADYSRVNLVYAVMDKISSTLTQNTDQLSLELTEILVNELNSAKEELAGKASSVVALSANTNRNIELVSSLEDSLSKVNVHYPESFFDLNELETSIKALENNNVSTSAVTSDFRNIESKIKSLVDSLTSAETTIDEVESELSSIKKGLVNDKEVISELRESVTSITAGIENINVTNPEDIVTPIGTSIQPIVTEETFATRMFPTFLTLVLMFVCIMLASSLVMREKETQAYFRNFISPTSDSVFILGTYLTCLIIVLLQLLIIALASKFFIGNKLIFAIPALLIPLTLVASLFIFLGMIIGYIFNSQETGNLASLFLISAALFFSNTILPIESIPSYAKGLIALNPFVLGENILRKIFIFNFSLGEVTSLIIGLIEFTILFLIITYIALKMSRRRRLNQ